MFSYLKNNELEYSKNEILNNYFIDFEENPILYFDIFNLEITTIKVLENYLELLIPSEDRKFNGAFFTPTYIVDFIINEVKPNENDKNLDPSCGCGAFLIGLAEYYRNTFKKSIKKKVQ